MGPLIPLLWTSGDICPGFQSQGASLFCMLSCLCDPQIYIWCNTCWLYRGQQARHFTTAIDEFSIKTVVWNGFWSLEKLSCISYHRKFMAPMYVTCPYKINIEQLKQVKRSSSDWGPRCPCHSNENILYLPQVHFTFAREWGVSIMYNVIGENY